MKPVGISPMLKVVELSPMLKPVELPPVAMPSAPMDEIPLLPFTRLKPTNANMSPSLLPVPFLPKEVAQLDEPASLGAGGRGGRDRPTRHRGNTDGNTTRSLLAVPIEKEGIAPRPARPMGGSPPVGVDLGWKPTRESPSKPRGGGRRSSASGCGGAMESR